MVDNHKELHILCAIGLVVASAVHTAAHLAYIVPALSSSMQNLQELNNMTSCGMCALGTGKCAPLHPNFVEWPACPFEKIPQYYHLTFLSTTGVSGILLWATLLLLWYYSRRKRRTSDYNLFQHVHTIGMVLWVFLLWLHGQNKWVGASFSLSLVLCAPSLPYYWYDRCGRWGCCLHACTTTSRGKVASFVLRDSGDRRSAAEGESFFADSTELFRIRVSVSNRFISKFWSGMYANIQVPSLPGSLGSEWHPFTICSGDEMSVTTGGGQEHSIEFIIAAAGDWTRALLALGRKAHPSLVQELGRVTHNNSHHNHGGRGMSFSGSLSGSLSESLSAGGRVGGRVDGEGLEMSSAALLSDSLLEDPLASSTSNSASSASSASIMVNVAGPYSAPTVSAGSDRVLIVVGGGVGITPFLSYLEMLASLESGGEEGKVGQSPSPRGLPQAAHFFWSTRVVDDVLFAWPLLQRILKSPQLRNVIFLHIHVTKTVPKKDHAASMLFRQTIARQNERIKADATMNHLPRARNNDLLYCRAGPTDEGIPIAFGRPNFKEEFYSIGKDHTTSDVSVYVCGNPGLVGHLQQMVDLSNSRNKSTGVAQRFQLRQERFD